MKTGLVVTWLKQAGAAVQQGEPIVEIESEKATNEVDAPAGGVLRWIEVNEGDSAPVGAAIAVIAAPGEELTDQQIATLLREDAEIKRQRAEALARPATSRAPVASASPRTARAPISPGGRVNASPAARRMAQELGVELAEVVGTGPGGMIGREDVQRAAEEARRSAAEGEERSVVIDGVTVHCLIAGPPDAPRLVFVHGLGGSLATWALNLPALAGQFRLCALDLPGAGDSDKPDMDYSTSALADFLARFLDALGTDWHAASLIGHSLGGAVALTFAARYSERATRLVLVDSAGLGPEIDAVTLDLMQRDPSPEYVREELSRFFTSSALVQQGLVAQIYRQRALPGAHRALLATMNAAFGGGTQRIDLRDSLGSLAHSTLIIWGDDDLVIPVSHIQIARHNPQVRVERFANCGHCPHIEQSDAFNRLVAAFLVS